MNSLKNKLLILVMLLHVSVYGKPLVEDLRCELRSNPSGIDIQNPRMSWKIAARDERGVNQTGYHILVASSPEKLAQDHGDLWDSGPVESTNSIAVRYAGESLKSRTQVYWKVKITTNKGVSAWSSQGTWTMGLLHYKDWLGRWIGFDKYFETDDQEAGTLAARYFRKEFSLTKRVQKAEAYVMGLGLYEFYLDGKKVGDQVLAPTPTDYTKNIKYNVFDVTHLLDKGEHTIGLILGNGRFYAMRQSKPYKVKNFGFPKLQMQLMVTYDDGSTEVIKTDNTWKGTSDGPIMTNNEYDGERYDARKELKGWASSKYDDKKWIAAEYVQEPGGSYESQLNNQMKVMQDIKPVSIKKVSDNRYIIDYGQNFSGWVQMTVRGEPGRKVVLRYAESLDEKGELFTTNLRDAKSTDVYILDDQHTQTWEPRFTYHGFRFVEVSGYPGQAIKDNFIGRFVYDDLKTIGQFRTSNILLNQIYTNAWWGIASNYKGMPVDCPQRNERQPWLGDRPISAYGESFLFENTNFYIKWLNDIRLAQTADGSIPDVAPAFWRYYSDNISWPGTYLFIADMLYEQTADKRVIEDNYPSMKKWMSYMRTQYMNHQGIITKDSYGDWCFPPATIEIGRGKIADKKYPNPLISSAYYYHLLNLMSKFSGLIDNQTDSVDFVKQAQKLRIDFNKTFYNKDSFYGHNTLTENLLAMNFGLVEDWSRIDLQERIVQIIEQENKGHLSTGVIGTQWIMRTLTRIGRSDLAYKLATNTTYPSWGYMVENGATTIWELWNGNTAHPKMNSQNHVMMLGDLLVWYYEDLAGIKSVKPGFQEIQMYPQFITKLDSLEASYESLYGKISSKWKQDKNTLLWDIEIPAGSRAYVYLPTADKKNITLDGEELHNLPELTVLGRTDDRLKVAVGSGKYHFIVKR